MSATSLNGGAALAYDAAGDVIGDGLNSYLYDAEGRLCAVLNYVGALTGYVYDAGGQVARSSQCPGLCPVHLGFIEMSGREAGGRMPRACPAPPVPSSPPATAYYNTNNQVTFVNQSAPSTISTPGGFTYDVAGNVLIDNANTYRYDPEGRICAVASTPVAGITTMTGYLYDAEGRLCAVQSQRYTGAAVIQYIYDAEGARIGKGTLASAPSSYTATCAPPLASGFTLTVRYLVDLGGDQVTELSEQGLPTPQTEQWQHSNVWSFDSGSGAGKLTATYDYNYGHGASTTNWPTRSALSACRPTPWARRTSNAPACPSATTSTTRLILRAQAAFSLPTRSPPPTTLPNITSPAKNGTPNPETTTSKRATTAAPWAASCPRTGAPRKMIPFLTQTLMIHRASIFMPMFGIIR